MAKKIILSEEFANMEIGNSKVKITLLESQMNISNSKCQNITVNKLCKQLNLVTLDFEGYANFASGYNLVGKLPNGYIPKASGYYTDILLYFPVIIAGMVKTAFGRITKDGNIEVYNTGTDSSIGYVPSNTQIRIHILWFI